MLFDRSLQKLKVEGINKCHIFVFSNNEIGNAFWSSKVWTKREDIFVDKGIIATNGKIDLKENRRDNQ